MEYASNQYNKTEGCQPVTKWLDLQTLGSQPIMPKNLLITGIQCKRSMLQELTCVVNIACKSSIIHTNTQLHLPIKYPSGLASK
jgi:hypothetical protein